MTWQGRRADTGKAIQVIAEGGRIKSVEPLGKYFRKSSYSSVAIVCPIATTTDHNRHTFTCRYSQPDEIQGSCCSVNR